MQIQCGKYLSAIIAEYRRIMSMSVNWKFLLIVLQFYLRLALINRLAVDF